ncbi:hypothetical protein RHGRI_020936 [Rhododendron griersonianum]|uniref:Uncharacterized protein n=1 Tax=Rhododendron griersonianum TaxID=479676 RepID=A0AAV6JJI4_9ERIC|nr:hypothetical protein RHGRI_020936 [Rhododendron griersonianum]
MGQELSRTRANPGNGDPAGHGDVLLFSGRPKSHLWHITTFPLVEHLHGCRNPDQFTKKFQIVLVESRSTGAGIEGSLSSDLDAKLLGWDSWQRTVARQTCRMGCHFQVGAALGQPWP